MTEPGESKSCLCDSSQSPHPSVWRNPPQLLSVASRILHASASAYLTNLISHCLLASGSPWLNSRHYCKYSRCLEYSSLILFRWRIFMHKWRLVPSATFSLTFSLAFYLVNEWKYHSDPLSFHIIIIYLPQQKSWGALEERVDSIYLCFPRVYNNA